MSGRAAPAGISGAGEVNYTRTAAVDGQPRLVAGGRKRSEQIHRRRQHRRQRWNSPRCPPCAAVWSTKAGDSLIGVVGGVTMQTLPPPSTATPLEGSGPGRKGDYGVAGHAARFLDGVVVAVREVNIAAPSTATVEGWFNPKLRGGHRAIRRRPFLDGIVAGIRDVNIARRIHGHARGAGRPAVTRLGDGVAGGDPFLMALLFRSAM